jgi:central kinetochore subunit Mal2/MCM21
VKSLRLKRATLSARTLATTSAEPIHATLSTASLLEDDSPFSVAAAMQTAVQKRHEQENLYRLGAGATMFTVKDPDPAAIDSGRIVGIRIEVFVSGRFLTPYYVLLNRLQSDPARLRIHRHTIPPCIPLSALAAKYLPLPRSATIEGSEKRPNVGRQALTSLVRELRRELVAYHTRLAKLQAVKKRLKTREAQRNAFKGVQVDMEAREIRLHTKAGLMTRIRVDKIGAIEKCVAMEGEHRDRELERAIVAHGTLDGLGDILKDLV